MEARGESLGKKIVIVGASASGKSTFARKLAVKTSLPLVHIDARMWKSGWNYIGDEETVRILNEESQRQEWIIEGYIEKAARSALFERADTIIYLDYPGYLSAWRYLKRWWKHRTHPRPELPGSPEKFSLKFLKLVWTKGETRSLNRFLEAPDLEGKIHRLHAPKQATVLLKKI